LCDRSKKKKRRVELRGEERRMRLRPLLAHRREVNDPTSSVKAGSSVRRLEFWEGGFR